MSLSSKQRKTLKLIFEVPTRSDIVWRDVESLFMALGANVTQGRGSRVRVSLNGVRSVFHEPHPERVTDKGAVISVREFLEKAGIEEKGERDKDADAQGVQRTV